MHRGDDLRALANGIRIRVVDTKHVAAGVDTPEDLERVRRLIADLRSLNSDELRSVPRSSAAFFAERRGTSSRI